MVAIFIVVVVADVADVGFANSVLIWSGFRSLPQDKQIKLCQETIYPISLLYHSQGYDLQQRKVKFFCYTDEVSQKWNLLCKHLMI